MAVRGDHSNALLIRGVPEDTRRAFSAGAVRLGLTQASFLTWLLKQHAAHIVKAPEVPK